MTFNPSGSSEVKFDDAKLNTGLQQTPLHHPAKFQPDRANSLRDVRYQSFSPFTLGLTAGPKFTKRADDLLPTWVYHPAKFHHPASTHARDIPYKNLADKESYKVTNSKRYIPSMPIGMWG